MKLLLDCDDVFERLTRGPFPSGDPDDGAVEAHLRVCHECRELAEALRPAVKLLHEAYADAGQQESALPVYQGNVSLPASSPARQLASSSWSGWQFLAATLLGIAIGAFALGSRIANQEQTVRSPANPAASGLAILASLKLNDVCLPSSMALAANQRLRCCTDCHSSTAAHRKDVDVARLQLACVACHEPRHE